MRSKIGTIAVACVVVIAFSLHANAQQENVLYTFVGGTKSGSLPSSGVIKGANNSLYGVTTSGGTFGSGIVYELSQSKGTWNFNILHSFVGGNNGKSPVGNLVLDASGNLYGVAETGGTHGLGIAFELVKPTGSGAWKEIVLYNFGASNSDGDLPQAGLIFDAAGNLYGTTSSGGEFGGGTAFELEPQETAPWKETILHSFGGVPDDGSLPVAALIMDKSGKLYGTTENGGGASGCFNNGAKYGGCGTVFEMTKSGSGWTETVLYAFQNGSIDENYPLSSVVLDAKGNLYGTEYGDPSEQDGDFGELFQLAHSGDSWTFNLILYLGCDEGCPDGAFPAAGLTFDSAGNLWGAVTQGGIYDGGVILEVPPEKKGIWNVKVPYQFTGSTGGSSPAATPLVMKTGQLIGTTVYGGDPQCNCGVVYEVKP